MPYRIIKYTKIIIQYKILDFFYKPIWETIDCRTAAGRKRYKALFGQLFTTGRKTDRLPCENHINPLELYFAHKESIQFLINTFNERDRRLFVGFLATVVGEGGIEAIANLTGIASKTVRRGQKEVRNQQQIPKNRIRQPGGGRLSKEREVTQYREELEAIIEDELAGDPMSEKKWVRKTLRWIHTELGKKQINASPSTIRKTLKSMKITLKKNRKSISTQNHPQRNNQFNYLNQLKNDFLKAGKLVISIDTKKKEQIGNYCNPGSTWRKDAYQTLDHDFPSTSSGKLIPFGIYDLQQNEGYIYCGTSVETSQFIVEALTWWWLEVGQFCYPDHSEILILCDSGGANGYRRHGWKWELQTQLIDSYKLKVTVCHYPSGASKWNPIEHRLFSFISLNWQGEPLTSYNKALEFIRSTTTSNGLKISAALLSNSYRKGIKVTKEQIASLNITRHQILPQWNYSLLPRV